MKLTSQPLELDRLPATFFFKKKDLKVTCNYESITYGIPASTPDKLGYILQSG